METNKKIWTKKEIANLLITNEMARLRGCVKLFELQELDEQKDKATKYSNGVGFTGADSAKLSKYAEKILKWSKFKNSKYPPLTEYQSADLAKKILKYSGQLAKVANGKLQILSSVR